MKKCLNSLLSQVQDEVPADRLLVFRATDGWEPLCKFLDVPVPDVPYPRTNERAQFQASVNAMRKLAWVVAFLGPAMVAGMLAYCGSKMFA